MELIAVAALLQWFSHPCSTGIYSLAEDEFYRTISAFIVDGKAYAGALSGRQQTARMLVLITLQKLAVSSIAAIRSALTRRRE
jgi:hypothetical protein